MTSSRAPRLCSTLRTFSPASSTYRYVSLGPACHKSAFDPQVLFHSIQISEKFPTSDSTNMQKSSSFSDSRIGKPRPADLFAERSQPSESLPWPSPSFDVFQAKHHGNVVSADPGRPSTQALFAPIGALPPTPVTATYKQGSSEGDEGNEGSTAHVDHREHVRLPSVRSLLAHTSPASGEMRTVALPSDPEHDEMPPSARLRTIPLPPVKDVQTPRLHPSNDLEKGSAAASRSSGFPHSFGPLSRKTVSPDTFREMPSSDEVQGLGLDLGEATPRMDSHGDWSMQTPTLSTAPRMPDAPHLSSAESGRLARLMTSPIQPPLRNWNTDLRFEDARHHRFSEQDRPAATTRSFSEMRPRAAAMEREHAMTLERQMPSSSKGWGLALSMDDGQSFRRGDYLYRADGSLAGPMAMTRSATEVAAAPPTPVRRVGDKQKHKQQVAPNSAPQFRTVSDNMLASSSTPMVGKFRATGLTPHVHKTRLTPTFSAKKTTSPTSGGTESPSLKMKSKKRSEQLRTQAASVAAQRTLPSDHVTMTVAPPGYEEDGQRRPSPVRSASFPTSPSFSLRGDLHPHTVPMSASPRKRSLGDRDGAMRATASTGKPSSQQQTPGTSGAAPTSSSPWGVFEIHSSNSSWQPLGPPALSNVLGKLNLDEGGAGADDDEDDDDHNGGDDQVAADSSASSKPKRARKGSKQTKPPSSSSSNSSTPVIAAPPTPLMVPNRMRSTSPTKKVVSAAMGRPGSRGSNEGKENDVFGSFSSSGVGNRSRRGTPVMGGGSGNVSPSKSQQQLSQQQDSQQQQQQLLQRRLLSIR